MGIDDESSHPELCSEVADGVTRTIVCLFREPDAGNLPVRFDEREQETGPSQTGLRRRRESFVSSHREAKATAPVLDSTPHYACAVKRRWSTAGEGPARELGSLHPEAIRAAVEETKPS